MEFPDGLSARDFKKISKLFDFLSYSFRGIRALPGIHGLFPKTAAGGSHMHPACRFVGNYLDAGRQYCVERSTPQQLALALESEATK